MRNKKVGFIVQAAMIAAVYVVLTIFISAFNLASGAIQVRISEALTILPFFTPAAVPGLFIGCLLSNLLTGAAIYDIVFGSLATLLGAVGTYLLRKHKFLCTIPPVISNAIIVGLVLTYGYGIDWGIMWGSVNASLVINMVTVGIGEIICCCILGTILLNALDKVKYSIFKTAEN